MIGRDSSHTPTPLPYAIETLLAHERDIFAQPAMLRARALARARAAMREPQPKSTASRPVHSPMRRLIFAAAAGIVLTAGVAAAYQMLRHPEPAMPSASTAPARHFQPTAPPVAPPEAAAPPIVPADSPPAAEPEATNAAGTEDNEEELRLLVRARKADVRGDHASVLTVLAKHERKFASGRLAEEREALRIKALVGLGRTSEARQTAASFRRQFPRSVLLHKIDDMLTSAR